MLALDATKLIKLSQSINDSLSLDSVTSWVLFPGLDRILIS